MVTGDWNLNLDADAAGYAEKAGLSKAIYSLFRLQLMSHALSQGAYPLEGAEPPLLDLSRLKDDMITRAMITLDEGLWLIKYAAILLVALTGSGLILSLIATIKSTGEVRAGNACVTAAGLPYLVARIYQAVLVCEAHPISYSSADLLSPKAL